ncbi:hypothetical protein ACFZDK_53350 [Streptomyces sp. NPDC007901]|uniref:hypothetical protein n=1 Tax=Streptomyces sp. NPDC007901 TaxID=3364785 RepID=UPI0036E9FB3C
MKVLADETPSPDLPGSFDPNADIGHSGSYLLNLLAWCVSAAAVAGVLVVGTQMALQLRRGEMGEGATYFRGLVIILGACVLAISSWSIVGFVLP